MREWSTLYFEPKLYAVLWVIAQLVGYDFDDSDRDAVAEGLRSTDADKDLWLEYPFVGSRKAEIRLAKEEDDMIVFELRGSPKLIAEVRGADMVATHYSLSAGPYAP